MNHKSAPYSNNHSSSSELDRQRKPRMLSISSVPDTHMVEIKYMDLKKGVGWGFNGCFTLPDLDNVEVYPIVLGGSEGKDVEFEMPDFAFNRICDADTNEKTLGYARKILADNSIPVLNHPDAVMGTKRDLFYQRFCDFKGIHVPKTVRIAPSYCSDVRRFIETGGIQLPCIFRPAGGHNQQGMVLLESLEDTVKLERYAFDGRDYYLIEFVDYRDEDGLYRKFRVVWVNGKLYPRHLFRGKHWVVGVETLERSAAADAEEKDFLENFEARLGANAIDALKAMCAETGLDYFGLDLNLRPDRTLLLFEANACMAVYADSGRRPFIKDYVGPIRDAVNRMVTEFADGIRAQKQ